MMELQVELLAPMAVGTGAGRPGVVDREVAVDEWGFPYLPGKRWKGLLREAYLELENLLPALLPPLADIFGKTGEQEGTFSIGNARLPHWKELSEWANRHGALVSRDDVTAAYTDIRRQTRIDDATGAAFQDMLRFTRVLRAGLSFRAECSVPEQYQDGLALATAFVRSSGLSRTSGMGEVRVRLLRTEGDSVRDLTAEAIGKYRANRSEWRKAASEDRSPSISMGELSSQPPLHVLRLVLELREPALLPDQTGDPNTALTRCTIPGSTIHGAVAAHWLRKHGVDDSFNRVFCSGRVRFLAANPALFDGQTPYRSQPVPLSFRVEKATGTPFDLVATNPLKPYRRVGDAFARWDFLWESGGAWRASVATSLSYHHLRAEDRRLRRAVGEEDAILTRLQELHGESGGIGTLFVYEHLEPRQFFAGAVLGSEADLNLIRETLPHGGTLRIGRSKSAQYGGNAVVKWEGPSPATASEVAQWAASAGTGTVETQAIVAVLLSPLLGRTASGHPAAEFPVQRLAEFLGVTGLKVQREIARVECSGGFLSHLRMPRQQWPSLRAGSVFVLEQPGNVALCIARSKWEEALQSSFGARVEEGFGRVALFRYEDWIARPVASLVARECRPTPQRSRLSPEASKFALSLYLLALDTAVTRLVQNLVEQPEIGKFLRPALLYRLSAIFEKSSWDDAGELLKGLRKPAIRQLEATRFLPAPNAPRVNMLDFLREYYAGWEGRLVQVARDVFQKWGPAFDGSPNPLLQGDRFTDAFRPEMEKLARRYLILIFGGIAGLQRRERRTRKRRLENASAVEGGIA